MTIRITTDLLEDAAERAAALARGVDGEPEAADLASQLRHLGETGALAVDAQRDDGDIRGYAALLRAISAECFSSAFSLWAHRMVIEYVRRSSDRALLDDLLAGRRFGSIAMATAIQELSGLGSVPTRATPHDDGGFAIDGRIAWASNIQPGTVVVLPAATTTDPDGRVIVAATIGEPGFTSTPVEDLLALRATRSASLQLDGVRIAPEHVLADSLAPAKGCRPIHFLLQSALCLGLADRCIAESRRWLDGPGAVFDAAVDRLAARRDGLSRRAERFAADTRAAPPTEVTRVRFESARLASETARLESAIVGGRSYVTTNDTNRRLREAMFLPVQSPSEVQLRWELDRAGEAIVGSFEI